MKQLRLFIAVPSTNIWESDFGMSLVFLTNYLASHPVKGFDSWDFTVWNKKGSILAQLRESLVEQALEMGSTHILFLDSDQTFPRDLAHRLLEHRKLVVACNVATKKLPSDPTARQEGKEHYGDLVYTTPTSAGLEEVWRVGTGIMLVNLNLFAREGMGQPWFEQKWNNTTGRYVGEDWAFCEKIAASGAKIYIDHDVSKQVGHVGKLNYGHDMVMRNSDEPVYSAQEEPVFSNRNVG